MASAWPASACLLGLVVFVLGKTALLGRGRGRRRRCRARRKRMAALRRRPRRGRGDLGAGPVSGRHPEPADRLGRRAARLCAVRERSSCAKEPRERMFAILFLIALNPMFWGLFEQAGGSMNLLHRPLRRSRRACRHRCSSRSTRSTSSCWRRSSPALWHWLGKRGLEPSAPAKFGLALAAGGLGLPGARLGRAGGRASAAMTPVIFVFLIYLLAHHRRAVPVAGRPVGDEPAGARASWPA